MGDRPYSDNILCSSKFLKQVNVKTVDIQNKISVDIG